MIQLTLAVMLMLIMVAPAAQAVTCRERLDELSKKMESVIDAKTKQDAAKEKEQAQQAMTKNDESGCMRHAATGLSMIHGD